MNESKRKQTDSYFADQISRCTTLAQQLSGDARDDEAIFAKIQMNVYDIFRAVFAAATKTAGQDDEKVVEFFLTKLQQIPRGWHHSLANATQHGDSSKAHIEQIKLDTAAQIKAAFEQIWEEAT
ncbi:MAG: hypothetical protein IJN31_03630 [Peptococcaceae bacterium]|nr:hypothetical protein [Peptococcaceae bacterium]